MTALETVIDSRKETANLYAQLAILAAAAKQDRKARSPSRRPSSYAQGPGKQLKSAIDLQKSQLTVQQPTSHRAAEPDRAATIAAAPL